MVIVDRESATATPSEISFAVSTPPTSTTSTPRAGSDIFMTENSDEDVESSIVSSSSSEVDSDFDSNDAIDSEDERSTSVRSETAPNGARTRRSPSIPTIGGPQKPRMQFAAVTKSNAQDLTSRLSAFLPRLAAANQNLNAGQNLEDVDEDDEQYIEMNLGLGVLEEKKDGEESYSSDEESNETEDEDETTEEQHVMADEQKNVGSAKKGKVDIMGRLMGEKGRDKKKPAIEEVEDTG